jgi:hypothetical protein
LDAENAEKRTAAARQHAEWEAKQAAKPWVRRNPAPIFGVLILCFVSVAMWYGITHPPQRSQKTSTANDKPPVAYSDDVNGGFQRDVNKRSGDVNKVAERSDAGMGIMPETIDGNQGGE